jgi:hypothetical protein
MEETAQHLPAALVYRFAHCATELRTTHSMEKPFQAEQETWRLQKNAIRNFEAIVDQGR